MNPNNFQLMKTSKRSSRYSEGYPQSMAGFLCRLNFFLWVVSLCAIAIGTGTKAEAQIKTATLPINKVVATISDSSGPYAMVVNPNSEYVYVTNGNNTISVIDASTNQITSTFNANNPANLVITPNGSKLYVVNNGAGTVSVISTSTGALIKTVTLGGNPFAIAMSPSGKQVYVADISAGTVAIINTSTNQVLANKINVGGTPYSIAFAPDGTDAYVVNEGGPGYTSQIATSTKTIVTSSLGTGQIFNPSTFCVSPDSSTLYVCDPASYVDEVDVSTKAVTKTCLIGPEGHFIVLGQPAVTPSGAYLYVPLELDADSGTEENTVVMVDTSTGKAVGKPITVGNFPSFVAIAPNAERAYVINYDDNTISVINISL
jgi:YVTN family beta-propeller protein